MTPPLPDPALNTDQATVLDALCFLQTPVGVTRLAEFLGPDIRTARGTGFHGPELRQRLGELQALGQVGTTERGQWQAAEAVAGPRFAALLHDDAARARWWAAWVRLQRLDHAWHTRAFEDAELVAALRVVVLADGTPEAFERLCHLARHSQPERRPLLLAALSSPFDAALWQRVDPQLRYQLLRRLLLGAAAAAEPAAAPLWAWLQAQAEPAPGALHDELRLALAERRLLAGDGAGARRLAEGLDSPAADALRAAAEIAEGRWAHGAKAFDAAWKAEGLLRGKRKQLFSDALAWCQALALIAQPDPAAWAAARKFAAAEAGKRQADPYTFWGLWQTAIDQRLGDAPRDAAPFRLAPPTAVWLPPLQQLNHLLLAAWLGHAPADPAACALLADGLAQTFDGAGLHWLARLARRSAAQLLGRPPAPGDADTPCPFGAPTERWREALSAIVALGAAAGAAVAAPGEPADRLLWTVDADAHGRVRAIAALEQKAGARGLGRPRPVSWAALARRNGLPARDAAVLRALKKAAWSRDWVLDPALALPALIGHPHVAWAEAPEQFVSVAEALPQLEVLTVDGGWQFRLLDAIQPDDADPPGQPPLRLLRAADAPDRARLLRVTPAQLRVAELVRQGWQVPASARAELDTALRVLATHFQLASDADTGQEVPASAVLHAELRPQGAGLALRLVAAPFGGFGPRLAPGHGRARVTTVHEGATLSTRRDLAAERAHVRALAEASGGLVDAELHAAVLDEPEDALALVEALAGLGGQIVTEWPQGRALRVRNADSAQLALQARSAPARATAGEAGGAGWLALDGTLALDGGELLRLRSLLDKLDGTRGRYLALGDGDFLALSDALRRQLADLRALAQPAPGGDGALRLPVPAALAWSAQPDAPALAGDAAWQRRCADWAAAQASLPAPPPGLLAELRDYQLAGYQWALRLATAGFGAVLADDMGLGKTLQTLAVLAARATGGPALVVAPTSVCGNWLAEAARFTPGLRVALYGDAALPADGDGDGDGDGVGNDVVHPTADATLSAGAGLDGLNGSGEAAHVGGPVVNDVNAAGATDAADAPDSPRLAARRQQLQALGPGDLLVCPYGLLAGDAALLAARPWHTVVLDEAQAVKNAATARARAAQALDAGFRLALTGTPVENRLAELWSLMAFANPGLLGTAAQFQQRFAGPVERDGDAAAGRRLRRLVAPFLLRRTKAEVLADLPPRTEIVHTVVPPPREAALLEALREQAEARVQQALDSAPGQPAAAQMHLLAALTRLRRAACDPRLVLPEAGLSGAKVAEFERLARELAAGRHKTLVFSQFTDFLALLRERLDAAGLRHQYLDGSTPAALRSQRVAAFQAGEGDFFLISLKAGGFGLNLTLADYVIIADPWWNPAAEDQASGRAHRIGQTRPVTVYRLVTQGSIEERIVALHQRKRALADGVLAATEGADAGAAPLDAAQMLALLRGEDPGAD